MCVCWCIQPPENCYPLTRDSCPLVYGSLLLPVWTRSNSSRRVTIQPSAMWAPELRHQAAPSAWVSRRHFTPITCLRFYSIRLSKNNISYLLPPALHSPAGNQARVADKSTVVSTSTRNFPNRLGKGANVFLASAELASIAAIEGKLPSVDEYQKYASKINETSADTFRYLNFDRLSEYVEKGKSADLGPEVNLSVVCLTTTDKGSSLPNNAMSYWLA